MLNISIVLYKTDRAQAKRAINSALATQLNVKVMLVDNSPSNALNDLTTSDERVEYVFNPTNPGYGAAHNLALRESLASGAKYHLVLNPDVYFEKGVLESLTKYMDEHPNVGHVMPKVLYPDGQVQHLCKFIPSPVDLILRRFIPIESWKMKRTNFFELRFTGYDREMEVPYLSGCFMFLRVDALKQVGLFDERFFMYPEDIDLTRRMHEKFKTIFYPAVRIVHEHGKESYKSKKMLLVHMWNLAKYFNKWGWFFDSKRLEINRKILQHHEHDKVKV